ncbi:MAG: cation:dicarboxylase symporter family transporter [Alphaproteobacteria bacterium]|nr:cation:dicarboxylase symporter family transporter [Alphaproteobacteria bacterium]
MRSGFVNVVSSVLLSPWAGIFGLLLGAVIGFTSKELSDTIAPFGDIYIALLQMCVLPLIMSAVVNSFCNLVRSSDGGALALKLTLYFTAFMVFASIIGILVGVLGSTGHIDEESKTILGKLFLDSGDKPVDDKTIKKGWGLVNSLIPTNIFYSLSQGRILEVVFFSILLGVSLGLVKHPASSIVYTFFSVTFDTVFMIIKWILHALPFGIACIVASQVSITGFDVVVSLLKFVAFYCLGMLVLFTAYTFLMAYATKKSLFEVIEGIQETLLISIGTQSFVAAIPQLIEDLEKYFKINPQLTHLFVPLGLTINRQGIALLFTLTAITVAQMYDISLGVLDIIAIVVGMSFVSMAAIGPVFATAPLIAFVLDPLGLPSSAGIIFITATSPILTPFVVMVSSQGVAVVTALIARGHKVKEIDDEGKEVLVKKL